MKIHFFSGPDGDDIERAPCGTWLGEGSGLSEMWELVDCSRCQAMKAKIIESAANEERAIVEQMGDMASFMRAEDGKQKGEAMTTNQTTDGVPRRVCHACVSYPRDAYCPVCDPATQGEQVARITLQQVLKAYDYANCHPNKYLRGTSNWCAAVAHSLNTK